MARNAGSEDHVKFTNDNYFVSINDSQGLRVSTTDVVCQPIMSASVSVLIASGTAEAGSITATNHLVLADASSAEFGLTLPAASTVIGRTYIVKKIDGSANAVLLSGSSGESVEGADFQTIAGTSGSVSVMSDGIGWHIVGFFSGVLST